jgi:hypothetical protein
MPFFQLFLWYVHFLNAIISDINSYIVNYQSDSIFNNITLDFFQNINSFGHVRFEHDQNIRNLENCITQSFVQIISESLATSFVPYITEKFLYSVVTRGLFLSYAQPGWHDYLEKYYGFRKYTQLFDYRFDTIENPIERLVELMTMLSKFSHLTPME